MSNATQLQGHAPPVEVTLLDLHYELEAHKRNLLLSVPRSNEQEEISFHTLLEFIENDNDFLNPDSMEATASKTLDEVLRSPGRELINPLAIEQFREEFQPLINRFSHRGVRWLVDGVAIKAPGDPEAKTTRNIVTFNSAVRENGEIRGILSLNSVKRSRLPKVQEHIEFFKGTLPRIKNITIKRSIEILESIEF